MSNEKRKALVGLFFTFYLLAFFIFSIWFLIGGGFEEPCLQLYSFLTKTQISSQSLSLEIVIGFTLLIFYLCLGLILSLFLIFRVTPKIYLKRWGRFFDLKFPLFFYTLLGKVSAEEIVFRWFPLAVLFPLWNTKLALWIIILSSSTIFGLGHIYNQPPRERKVIFVTPQVMGGVILSYVFLAFGFWGTLAVHLVFNTILLFPLKVSYDLYPDIFR